MPFSNRYFQMGFDKKKCRFKSYLRFFLTHCDWDSMADICRRYISNAISWKKMLICWFKFTEDVQLTISNHWIELRAVLANDDIFHWSINAWLGLNESRSKWHWVCDSSNNKWTSNRRQAITWITIVTTQFTDACMPHLESMCSWAINFKTLSKMWQHMAILAQKLFHK